MKFIHVAIAAFIPLSFLTASTHAQWTFNGVKIFYNAGNVGIGTSNPAHKLDVRSAGSRAVFGWAMAASGTADGVYGISNSTSGRGVVGYNDADTGFNYGVYGRADSTKGRGVYGYAASSSGVNMGVYGKTNSPDGYAGYFAGNVGVTGWIGTKSDAPVEIYSNNERVFHIQSRNAGGSLSVNVIGGYKSNSVPSDAIGATIAGGGASEGVTDTPNTATSHWATIGGGKSNTAHLAGTVSGGIGNNASGSSGSTVGGGISNTASGFLSTIPGGQNNTAGGSHSLAAGFRAKANHHGSLVWGDSTDADIASSANNQTTFRSVGGVRIFTNTGLTAGVTLAADGSAWAAVSDRNAKENFSRVNAREVLDKLVAMPIETWNYKSQDKTIRHIGPMAQDFSAAFGLGEDELRITTIDADGVALAAIQGLHHIVCEKERELNALRAEKDQQMADLAARLKLLESMIVGQTTKGNEP